MNIDEIIADLESRGLGWDIGHTARLREIRIWNWPDVISRKFFKEGDSLLKVFQSAIAQISLEKYPKRNLT